MERLPEIRARIKSLGELADVVGAMRALAAVCVQQARGGLPGIRKYTELIDGALAQVFAHRPPAEATPGPSVEAGASATIVFTSEHGFVGAFNARMLGRAATELTTPDDRLLVVGSRGSALASERAMPVSWSTPMATHRDGVAEVARAVANEVYRRAGRGGLRRVSLVYAKSAGGAASEVVVRVLLPFDPTPYLPERAGAAPRVLTNLEPRELLDRLVDELVLAELMRAGMESFASENGARLATMESARSNIEKKLDELSADERRRRQDEITTELLDIVTGAEAVARERRDAGAGGPQAPPGGRGAPARTAVDGPNRMVAGRSARF